MPRHYPAGDCDVAAQALHWQKATARNDCDWHAFSTWLEESPEHRLVLNDLLRPAASIQNGKLDRQLAEVRARRRFYVIGFFLLVCLDTLAQVSFKLSANAAAPFDPGAAWLVRVLGEPWIYVALACYLCTFFTWMTLLTHAPIGPAYAASHLEIVSVLVCSALIFNEPISLPRVLGCMLIVLGIAILSIGASRSAAPASAREH